ncbi:MAG: hypothetical protein [Wendovervirus sonii]|uniref:Uncharacterized protein n=1 Tax=phage Lak_Megaphage_Sonny TaxID=3109229 RepID=A0ABZ0Z5V9_9CAUD|nr:MAG: hypothetical protein [phage Lak_Megaphage_Sonny]
MLYHLSKENMNGKILYPRIPKFAATLNDPGYENNQTPRICFSSSISGAYRALKTCEGGPSIMYVHVPDGPINPANIIKCTEADVYDSIVTGEYWITEPVKMKCIAKIYITYNYQLSGLKKHWHSDGNWDVKHHVHFRYIERYDDITEQLCEAIKKGLKNALRIC